MSAIPMKEITLEQAMKDQGAGLWVVNRSVRPGLSAGQVHITVHESNGQAINVRIPVTHIPVDLTTSATRKALLECPSLRNALQKGLIGLVSSESALAVISTPEGRAEHERINSAFGERPTILNETAPEELKAAIAAAEDKVCPQALHIAHSTEGEENLVASLKLNEKVFTQDDLAYIVNNSTLARVKATAAAMIVN